MPCTLELTRGHTRFLVIDTNDCKSCMIARCTNVAWWYCSTVLSTIQLADQLLNLLLYEYVRSAHLYRRPTLHWSTLVHTCICRHRHVAPGKAKQRYTCSTASHPTQGTQLIAAQTCPRQLGVYLVVDTSGTAGRTNAEADPARPAIMNAVFIPTGAIVLRVFSRASAKGKTDGFTWKSRE